MSLIQICDLTFYYDGSSESVFENVSLQFDTNWKLGLIGRNGRGKTTLLQLLMGNYEYRGKIKASVGFDYFPFQVPDKSQDVIAVIERIYPDYELWKICRELSLLDVDAEVLYRPYDTLSNGEQAKIMLAVLFSREERFLLIDEPTNHLDRPARKLVKEYLNRKKGFILVSHDRDFLDGCIDYVMALNKQNIEITRGNFSTWQEDKKRRDACEYAENEKLKKDIKRLTQSAAKACAWADSSERDKIGGGAKKREEVDAMRDYLGEKSRRMQRRRKNLERRLEKEMEEKSSLLKNIEKAEVLKIIPLVHYKDCLVEAEHASLYYGGREVCTDISFQVRRGDRVVLEGRNGSGKSSILKKILGDEIELQGRIACAPGLKISYVSQSTDGLEGNLKDYAEVQGLDESLFKALLRKLDFEREQFGKDIRDFSSGQKKKVLLAGSLCEQAHLYIWDEPLNYIDVFSRIQIEELLREFRPSMLFVEHDKAFVDNIATKCVNL